MHGTYYVHTEAAASKVVVGQNLSGSFPPPSHGQVISLIIFPLFRSPHSARADSAVWMCVGCGLALRSLSLSAATVVRIVVCIVLALYYWSWEDV